MSIYSLLVFGLVTHTLLQSIKQCSLKNYSNIVSLPQGKIQEIKRLLLVYPTHGLFLTWTQKSHYIYSSHVFNTIFTRHVMYHPTQPLTSRNSPYFTYLENQLLFSWWRIPIHPCLWSANNCPTVCFAPLTLSCPTVQVTFFT